MTLLANIFTQLSRRIADGLHVRANVSQGREAAAALC